MMTCGPWQASCRGVGRGPVPRCRRGTGAVGLRLAAFQFGEALPDGLQFGLKGIGLVTQGGDVILGRGGYDRPWPGSADTPGTISPPEAAGAKTGAEGKAPTAAGASPPPQTGAAGTQAPAAAGTLASRPCSIKNWQKINHLYGEKNMSLPGSFRPGLNLISPGSLPSRIGDI
jgi:hypothetical protein